MAEEAQETADLEQVEVASHISASNTYTIRPNFKQK